MRKTIQILTLVWLLVAAGCGSSGDPVMRKRLDRTLGQLAATGAVYAARVVDLETGRELYAHRADAPMIPASNGKLAPGAAALDRLGPDFKFTTVLIRDNDNLAIVGCGDPATGDPKLAAERKEVPTSMFDQWSSALKAKGITHIRGDLLYYDGTFDDQTICPGWSKGYLTDWYAAPVTGLNFNDNCVDVVATPGTEGAPATLTLTTPNMLTQVVNDTRSGGKGPPEVTRAADRDVFTVSGEVSKRTELESKAVTDPSRFFAECLRANLASNGIVIDGSIRRVTAPPTVSDSNTIAVYQTSFKDVLRRINKNSQNLFAEAVCKMLGRAYDEQRGLNAPGSWKSGGEATHEFLKRHGIDDSRYVLVDGSGLARGNRVTARMITDLFVVMHTHRYSEVFFNTLPIGGKDGTISKRMKDIEGHVFAKTGYIGGVRALSGYVRTRRGQWLAFSIIFNEIPGSVAPFEALQDDACRVLVAWPDAPPATRPATAPSSKPVP